MADLKLEIQVKTPTDDIFNKLRDQFVQTGSALKKAFEGTGDYGISKLKYLNTEIARTTRGLVQLNDKITALKLKNINVEVTPKLKLGKVGKDGVSDIGEILSKRIKAGVDKSVNSVTDLDTAFGILGKDVSTISRKMKMDLDSVRAAADALKLELGGISRGITGQTQSSGGYSRSNLGGGTGGTRASKSGAGSKAFRRGLVSGYIEATGERLPPKQILKITDRMKGEGIGIVAGTPYTHAFSKTRKTLREIALGTNRANELVPHPVTGMPTPQWQIDNYNKKQKLEAERVESKRPYDTELAKERQRYANIYTGGDVKAWDAMNQEQKARKTAQREATMAGFGKRAPIAPSGLGAMAARFKQEWWVQMPAVFAMGNFAQGYYKDVIGKASHAVEIENWYQKTLQAQATKSGFDSSTWLNKFATNSTFSKLQAKEMATQMYTNMMSGGMDKGIALNWVKKMLPRAADIASLRDVPIEDVISKIQSGITGLPKPLKAYGIDVTIGAMREYMKTKGVKGDWKTMALGQKQNLILEKIYKDSEVAQGDMVKTLKQYANQLRYNQARLEDFNVVMGQSLMPIMKGLAGAASQVTAGLLQWYSNLSPGGQKGVALGAAAGIGAPLLGAGALYISMFGESLGKVLGIKDWKNINFGGMGKIAAVGQTTGLNELPSVSRYSIATSKIPGMLFAGGMGALAGYAGGQVLGQATGANQKDTNLASIFYAVGGAAAATLPGWFKLLAVIPLLVGALLQFKDAVSAGYDAYTRTGNAAIGFAIALEVAKGNMQTSQVESLAMQYGKEPKDIQSRINKYTTTPSKEVTKNKKINEYGIRTHEPGVFDYLLDVYDFNDSFDIYRKEKYLVGSKTVKEKIKVPLSFDEAKEKVRGELQSEADAEQKAFQDEMKKSLLEAPKDFLSEISKYANKALSEIRKKLEVAWNRFEEFTDNILKSVSGLYAGTMDNAGKFQSGFVSAYTRRIEQFTYPYGIDLQDQGFQKWGATGRFAGQVTQNYISEFENRIKARTDRATARAKMTPEQRAAQDSRDALYKEMMNQVYNELDPIIRKGKSTDFEVEKATGAKRSILERLGIYDDKIGLQLEAIDANTRALQQLTAQIQSTSGVSATDSTTTSTTDTGGATTTSGAVSSTTTTTETVPTRTGKYVPVKQFSLSDMPVLQPQKPSTTLPMSLSEAITPAGEVKQTNKTVKTNYGYTTNNTTTNNGSSNEWAPALKYGGGYSKAQEAVFLKELKTLGKDGFWNKYSKLYSDNEKNGDKGHDSRLLAYQALHVYKGLYDSGKLREACNEGSINVPTPTSNAYDTSWITGTYHSDLSNRCAIAANAADNTKGGSASTQVYRDTWRNAKYGEMTKFGMKIKPDEMVPGDFFGYSKGGAGNGHMMRYVGEKDGQSYMWSWGGRGDGGGDSTTGKVRPMSQRRWNEARGKYGFAFRNPKSGTGGNTYASGSGYDSAVDGRTDIRLAASGQAYSPAINALLGQAEVLPAEFQVVVNKFNGDTGKAITWLKKEIYKSKMGGFGARMEKQSVTEMLNEYRAETKPIYPPQLEQPYDINNTSDYILNKHYDYNQQLKRLDMYKNYIPAEKERESMLGEMYAEKRLRATELEGYFASPKTKPEEAAEYLVVMKELTDIAEMRKDSSKKVYDAELDLAIKTKEIDDKYKESLAARMKPYQSVGMGVGQAVFSDNPGMGIASALGEGLTNSGLGPQGVQDWVTRQIGGDPSKEGNKPNPMAGVIGGIAGGITSGLINMGVSLLSGWLEKRVFGKKRAQPEQQQMKPMDVNIVNVDDFLGSLLGVTSHLRLASAGSNMTMDITGLASRSGLKR